MKRHKLLNSQAPPPPANPLAQLHGKLVTRREMLAAGVIPFAASLSLPPLMQLLAQAGYARAQDAVCPKGNVSGLCPVISISLAGGAGLASAALVRDQGGNLLPSYSKMGLGSRSGVIQLREPIFANKYTFHRYSGIYRGITLTPNVATNQNMISNGFRTLATTQKALDQSVFVATCVRSNDDSGMNKFDLSGMATKAGVIGSMLPNLGRANTDTGLSHSFAYVKPPAPLVVGSFGDIQGALSVTGALASLSEGQQKKMFGLARNLASVQAADFGVYTGGQKVADLKQCADKDNSDLIGASGIDVDPTSANSAHPNFRTIWNINAGSNKSSQDYVFGAMVYNALNGNAGTCNLTLGGYDYHDGSRTSGDTRDEAAGILIRKVIDSCVVMGVPAFIVVTSDGSVASAENDIANPDTDNLTIGWQSDRGSAGCAYMIAVTPTGQAAPVTNGATQLGWFTTTGQSADDKFITGNLPELASAAMFINFLNFNKKLNLIDKVIPRLFTTADIDSIIKIAKAA